MKLIDFVQNFIDSGDKETMAGGLRLFETGLPPNILPYESAEEFEAFQVLRKAFNSLRGEKW